MSEYINSEQFFELSCEISNGPDAVDYINNSVALIRQICRNIISRRLMNGPIDCRIYLDETWNPCGIPECNRCVAIKAFEENGIIVFVTKENLEHEFDHLDTDTIVSITEQISKL